jgi:hypothetical protein
VTNLLLDRGPSVRAMVWREDDRSPALSHFKLHLKMLDYLERTYLCRQLHS